MSLESLHSPIILNKNNAPFKMPDNDSMAYGYILPEGRRLNNELGDVIYFKDASVKYHDHQKGIETFFIDKGEVEVTINRRRAMVHQGDIMHIRPHIHHGFSHPVEGNVWRELFMDMDMYFGINERDILRERMPHIVDDPSFRERRLARNGTDYREMPLFETVDKRDIPEIIPADKYLRSYTFGGIFFGLKIPRWELDGVKEIWEISLPAGTVLRFDTPFDGYPLYLVRKGSAKITVFDREYEAKLHDIIHIPPYAPHTIALPEDTVLMSCNEQSQLLHLLEHLSVIRRDAPDDLKNWSRLEAVLRGYNCWLTGYESGLEESYETK